MNLSSLNSENDSISRNDPTRRGVQKSKLRIPTVDTTSGERKKVDLPIGRKRILSGVKKSNLRKPKLDENIETNGLSKSKIKVKK